MHWQGGYVQVPMRVWENAAAAIRIANWCGVPESGPTAQQHQAHHAEQLAHQLHAVKLLLFESGHAMAGLRGMGIAILYYQSDVQNCGMVLRYYGT
jgi:hypothetical protein